MALYLTLLASCLLYSVTLCDCVLFDDFSTDPPTKVDSLFLHFKLPFFGSSSDTITMLEDGSLRMHNILNFPVSVIGELAAFLLPQNSNISTVRYYKDVSSDSAKLSTVDATVRRSAAAATLPVHYEFRSQSVLVWTWDVSLKDQENKWTIQVALATDNRTTFAIYSYCARDFNKFREFNPQISVLKGSHPVITVPSNTLETTGFLGQDNRNIVRQFVFRVDQITCTGDSNYYCVKDSPKNFAVVNDSITATSANLRFMERLTLELPSAEPYTITYTLKCTDSNGVLRVTQTTVDKSEQKAFSLMGLTPNTLYTCALQKDIRELSFQAPKKEVKFRTNKLRPDMAPHNVSVKVVGTSVEVSWNSIPFSNPYGELTYQIKFWSTNIPARVVSTVDFRTTINGLKPGTTYTMTVAAINTVGTGPSSQAVQFVTTTAVTESESTGNPSSPFTDSTEPGPGNVGGTTESPVTVENTTVGSSETEGRSQEHSTTAGEVTTLPTAELVTTEVDDSSLASAELAAIVLGGVYAFSLIVILILVIIICAYRQHKRRKTYVVNRSTDGGSDNANV